VAPGGMADVTARLGAVGSEGDRGCIVRRTRPNALPARRNPVFATNDESPSSFDSITGPWGALKFAREVILPWSCTQWRSFSRDPSGGPTSFHVKVLSRNHFAALVDGKSSRIKLVAGSFQKINDPCVLAGCSMQIASSCASTVLDCLCVEDAGHASGSRSLRLSESWERAEVQG